MSNNSLVNKKQDGSRKAAVLASLDGKTAKLRMMEQIGKAFNIDDMKPVKVEK